MDACVVKPEKETGDSAATEAAATLQQILASSGTLVSPLQLLPSTGDGSSQSTSSIPFMTMSPYQMMVLPQSLLSAHGAAASASGSDGQADKLDKGAVSVVAGQSVADLLQKRDGTIGGAGEVLNQLMSAAVNQADRSHSALKPSTDHLKPPKKPLTPYMTFSKMIWPRVKAANPHLSSVCELGAIVGSMWRDLDPADKQYYNDQFTRDKVTYDEELRAYLKATGLTASDLVKPKPKKKDPRVSASSHHLLQQQQQVRAAANGSSPAAALSSTGQQLVQSLIGLQPQHDGLGNASSAAQGGTPEGWTAQAAQQLLAQMGLAGQTLFANSDGTISVDGSLLTIQGRPVQLASHDQAAMTAASSEASESSRGWAWHQPAATTASSGSSESGAGMVVYQLLTNGSAADGSTTAASGSQQPVYYGVDAYGQLVPTTKSPATVSANESRLQQEIASLRTALEEKTREADTLRSQLVELCATIERYRKSASNAEHSVKAEKSSSPANNVTDVPPDNLTAGSGE